MYDNFSQWPSGHKNPEPLASFKPGQTSDNDYDYDEIDEDKAQGPRSPFYQNKRHPRPNHVPGSVRYSQVSKPKTSIDEGEMIIVDNHIYA